ncbi:CBS domain-containing protein [Gimesia panareensis]|uniref:Inosine 5-monophosphate dehydrogenase n=1 Tax=Gimesia panareensis TaxID=2527978 RepID=A0A517Q940_9PLAN|nr:CBS domain-containing protein [Gimesia panareensis]QDT28140.1 inosine 5-monophosphate dehydrogenase [Gimesia panareensis]QDU51007.1 inosine 5-monophosphate dehydrogenase [Gimesia panareensis]
MQVRVRDLMTQSPVSVPLGTSLQEAARQMIQAESPEVYVTNEQMKLVGVIPEYNFLKQKLQQADMLAPVESIMHVQLETLSPDDDALQHAPLFRDRRNSCMPVTDDGRLVGKLTCRDLFRLMLTLAEVDDDTEQQASNTSATTEIHASSAEINPPHLNRVNSHRQLLQLHGLIDD